ncbi:MAG: SDR family oxidoreductase [Mycobacterium sp.]|nr:SDR family oxidoreductase [Mycobacterium sp.]
MGSELIVGDEKPLASKLAVVTGGAGGMGLAAARILGRDHSVLLSDIHREGVNAAANELRAAGVDCTATVCDVTDQKSVTELARLAQQLGPIGAIVHTAGVSPNMGSADLILRINAVGTVLVNTAFYDIATTEMAVVNVASVAGHQLPTIIAPKRCYGRALSDLDRFHRDLLLMCNVAPRRARPGLAYMLSKNFVIWFSKIMAANFGAKGARVLSVSPGSFDTPMGRLEERGAGTLVQLGALKRFGNPSEIAELLAFCAGDRAGYLTGTDIICDGGVMAAMRRRDLLRLA